MKKERKQFTEILEEELKQVTGGDNSTVNDACKVNVKEYRECQASGGVWINCKCS